MHVPSTLSYLVRTVILLYLINSTSAYKKQNLTVKNDYSSGISEKSRGPRPSSADKFLRESDHAVDSSLRMSHVARLEIPGGRKHDIDERFEKPGLQNLITGKPNKNDTSQTGVVKRTKRCLLAMMALGGLASIAADLFLPPEPNWNPPPTTTAAPVWNPPPPVWDPPPTIRTTTRPPTTTTTTRPPTTTTTTRPPTTTTSTRPPTTTTTTKPPTSTTTTKPPTTTTTTTEPPTTTTTEEPTTTTIEATALVPDEPTTIPKAYKPEGLETSIELEGVDHGPQRAFQKPLSAEYDNDTLKIFRDKWMNATGGAAEMGFVVMDGLPEYNISTAIVVSETQNKIAFNDIEVVEFVHPLTEEKILVPLNGGDEYVNPETHEAFIIFVDNDGRTFLIFKGIRHFIGEKYPDGNGGEDTWDIIENATTNVVGATNWGSIVVGGVPNYNISEGTIVNETKKKTDSNGTEVVEFVHPFTNESIQVPHHGGDEFVKHKTGEVFIIFVDNQNRTILIFKGIDHSVIGKYPDGNSGEDTWVIIVKETTNIVRETKWGSIVAGGVPKYNISGATIVAKSEQKTYSNGTEVLEFVHPFTNEIVQVPLNGCDEFVKRRTGEVFIIFVDIYRTTLLIFKGIDHSIIEKYPDGNNGEDTWNIIVKETTNIVRETKWGSVVVGGVPKYNISGATIVLKSEQKTYSNGTEVLEFVHPFTNEIVQVPLNGCDEFVKRRTGEVFIIFVDIYRTTLLIFKGIDHSIIEKYPDGNNGEDTWNIIVKETTNIVRETKWGSVVVGGVPKYNISGATIVLKSEQKTYSNGTEVLEFVHPFTNEIVQVPLNGCDEFVKRRTGEVFIVFVDIYGRTLLIFKGIDHWVVEKNPDGNHGEDTWNIIVKETTNIARVTKWGSIVVKGVPKYNISEATIVYATEKKINSDGTEVLEFVHPFTNEIVEVPLNGGDEFVIFETREVFIIFIDIYGRTLLIFKGIDHSIIEKYPNANNGEDTWNITMNDTTNIGRVTKWGSVVVRGVPKYNISEATIVYATEKKINSNGTEVLEFVHPFTNEIVEVPLNGGDKFVKLNTREVFIIFVDIYGRTLLIFKGIDHSVTIKFPNGNNDEDTWNIIVNETTNIVRETKWGSIVVRGVPKYNISEATIVYATEKKINSNGTEVLEFVHPFTNEIVQVPFNGGDEFVKRKTREVFIIFVDNQNRTIFVFKGIDLSLPSPGEMTNNTDSSVNIHENLSNPVKIVKDEWGSLVVGGLPKYDVDSATIIRETKQMIVNGISVLEFSHPDTQDKIRVPLNGGDEYINQTTKEIFIIFVDIRGKTLLILKQEQPMENIVDSKDDSDAKKIISESKWGSIVVKGVPEYNISSALIITKTKKKIGIDGTAVLEFVHPITQEEIQVPFDGGDEYVIPNTQHIFKIFVDIYNRTILILKDTTSSLLSNSEFEENTNKIEAKIEECWGTMVVGGNPKYDIANATIVEKTIQKVKNGVSVIEFTHPITLQIIDVPYKGGDEYVDPRTKQVFIIFVDILGRTILILRPSDSSVDSHEDPNAEKKYLPQTDQGSIVVGGVPKYDVATAMIVEKSKRRMVNGSLVVEFEHPITREVIHVASKDADEYVDPRTKQVFIIFVDILGRTILILKRSDSQQTNESNVDSNEKFDDYATTKKYETLADQKWGSVVVGGVPKYYMSRAIIVMDVKKKIGVNGISVLEFRHPITGQTIEVPANGGDEYVNPKTREVFVICVDLQRRTLLIFKGLDTSDVENYDGNSAEFDEYPDVYSNVNANVVTPDSLPFEDYENEN